MLWIMDEYQTIMGGQYPGLITGKPVELGGSRGRTEATGYGIIYILRELLKEMKMDIAKTTASIQGFGNVARYSAELFIQYGGTVVSVSCWDQSENRTYSYHKKTGIKLDELLKITDRFGTIDKKQAEKTWL